MATGAAAPRQYYVIFMTTAFRSLAEVQATAPAELATHLARSRQLHTDGVRSWQAIPKPARGTPSNHGVLVSREAAEDYARHDPFVRGGMMSDWTIREWANMLA